MGDTEFNSVATAIRGAEFEGFIAGTLFNEGWNVNHRALDIQSLIAHVKNAPHSISLILLSTDVDGLTAESLDEIKRQGIKYFLFASSANATERFPEAIAQPTSSLELLGLIRGSLRTPMIRGSRKEKIRARTIAFVSPSPSSGCTTLTINLGAELAQLGQKVLMVDAQAYLPAFAIRLGERGITDTTDLRNISDHLWILEVTQADITGAISALERARLEFDYILIDHGTLRDFPAILTGRRWCSEIFIWIATYADELWMMCKSDSLSAERVKALTTDLARHSIKPELAFIQNFCSSGKRNKSESESFLQLVTPLRPIRLLQYPWDPRNVLAAEQERNTLFDTNERGILRKSIAQIAGELLI